MYVLTNEARLEALIRKGEQTIGKDPYLRRGEPSRHNSSWIVLYAVSWSVPCAVV
jgi:hypothetical protein